jgi:hypothetical protein
MGVNLRGVVCTELARGVAVALALAGCGQEQPSSPPVGSSESALSSPPAPPFQGPTLNTSINGSIEIDELQSSFGGDANLFSISQSPGSPVAANNDPADSTRSVLFPAGGPNPYYDWNDLSNANLFPGGLTNHRLLDCPGCATDPTWFPSGKNSCMGPGTTGTAKEDVNYLGFASNRMFAYLTSQRSSATGDASLYVLFTKVEPDTTTQAGCKAGQAFVTYTITAGDVLFFGHYKTDATTPLGRVFKASTGASGVTAVDVVNFNLTVGGQLLWVEQVNAVEAAAVNTTITAPGSYGSTGVKSLSGGNLPAGLQNEFAIDSNVFSPTGCGGSFFGTAITRSSGAGGTSPDMVDFVGPAQINFASASATATLTPSCAQDFHFSSTVTGPDGNPLPNPSCAWHFTNGSSSFDVPSSTSNCAGDASSFISPVPTGSWSGTLTVTQSADAGAGCGATANTGTVNVFPPLALTVDLDPLCTSALTCPAGGPGCTGFNFSITSLTGGSGTSTKSWSFTGGTVSPTTSTAASGTVSVAAAGVTYTGTLTVTDSRTDKTCTATAFDTARPFLPLSISIAPDHNSLGCSNTTGTCLSASVSDMTTDKITYTGTPGGGNGVYHEAWSIDGSLFAGCNDLTSCGIDPPDSTFCVGHTIQVQLSDTSTDDLGNPLCSAATSNTGTYRKVTAIVAN